MRKTGKRLMLRTLHLTTFGSSGVQFLFIFCMPSMKEGSELMDRELATKVACKYGRKSNLAIAWELEVATIIDTRRPRGAIVGWTLERPHEGGSISDEKPFFPPPAESLPRNQHLTKSGSHKKYPIIGQTFLYNLLTTICFHLSRPLDKKLPKVKKRVFPNSLGNRS